MEQQLKKSMDFKKYLKRTDILDFDNPSIKTLVKEKGWDSMAETDKVKSIYNYVKGRCQIWLQQR
jgi:hypothetical protein